MLRTPPDILITTPESLYLMLTSQARELFAGTQWVIVDEIHAVAQTKRGAHLARHAGAAGRAGGPRRAAHRPVGDAEAAGRGRALPRRSPARMHDRRRRRAQAARPAHPRARGVDGRAGRAARARQHPRRRGDAALHLAGDLSRAAAPRARAPLDARLRQQPARGRAHRPAPQRPRGARRPRSAEPVREIARAHHGSLAREERLVIEDQLKAGHAALPGGHLVAGAGHRHGRRRPRRAGRVAQVGDARACSASAAPGTASARCRAAASSPSSAPTCSSAPSWRGACARASSRRPWCRATRSTCSPSRWSPSRPSAGDEGVAVDELHALVRAPGPTPSSSGGSSRTCSTCSTGATRRRSSASCGRGSCGTGVAGTIRARSGARALAVANAGTIPDRGLFTVNLPDGRRVGELDEEMVYEARAGQTFLLGATSWRIEQITRDRVVVTPAPGVPGAVPFWHGEGVGRPRELGEAIGAFARWAVEQDEATLERDYDLDERAAAQPARLPARAAGGDHASCPPTAPSSSSASATRSATGGCACCRPSAAASTPPGRWPSAARIRDAFGLEADAIWSDDGIIVHLPDADEPPGAELVLVEPDEVEDLVVAELGASALFGARFRENAARSLLIPRAYPGRRTPLWQQRLKAQSLLEVARRYPQFPVILETYRECLRDVLDVPGLIDLLRRLSTRELSLVEVETQTASPFASSLLFDYVATYMYEGDTPAAERRAVALALDRDLLRELLGQEELRDLIDAGALEQVEDDLQHRSEQLRARERRRAARRAAPRRRPDRGRRRRSASSRRRRRGRGWRGSRASAAPSAPASAARSAGSRPRTPGCYRDALGVVPPGGLPEAFLADVPDALAAARAPLRAHARPVRDGRGAGALRRRRRAGARRARAGRRARCAASCGRWARSASGATPRCCAACAAPRWRRCARRSSRSARRRWRASRRPGRASTGTRRAGRRRRRGCATSWSRCRAWRCRRSCGSATCCRGAWAPTRRRGSTSSARPASSCGSGRGRWAGARGASRCTSATTRPCWARPRRPASAPEGALHELLRERLGRGACFFADLLVEHPELAADELREALWDLVVGRRGRPTTPSRRCARAAPAPAAPLGASRSPARRGAAASAAAPAARRRCRAAGRSPTSCSARAPSTPTRGAAPGPSCCSSVTASSRASWCAPRASRAASPRSTRRSSALETLGAARRGYFVEGLGGAQFALPGAVERLRGQEEAPGGAPGARRGRPRAAVRRGAALARRRGAARRRRAAPAPTWCSSPAVPCSGRRGRRPRAARAHPGRRAPTADLDAALAALAAAVRDGRVPRLAVERIDGEPAVSGSPLGRAAAGPRLSPRPEPPQRSRPASLACPRATPSITPRGASAPSLPAACPTRS